MELLRERPEPGAFGADRLGVWVPYAGERIVEVARVAQMPLWLRRWSRGPWASWARTPWRPTRRGDGSEACISFGGIHCSGDGGVRRLGLEFKRLEPHEGRVREVYRPKGPPAFAKAKEYVRVLWGAVTKKGWRFKLRRVDRFPLFPSGRKPSGAEP